MANKINLSVSKELKQKLEKKTKETGFKLVQEYIIFVLEQVIFEDRKNERDDIYTKEEEEVFATAIGNLPQKTEDEDNPYTEQDEEKLKKHLEERGYI